MKRSQNCFRLKSYFNLIVECSRNQMCCDSKCHSHHVNALLELNDKRLVFGSCDLTIRFWDIKAFKQVGIIDQSNEIVLSFVKLSSGVLIFAIERRQNGNSSDHRSIKLWNIKSL